MVTQEKYQKLPPPVPQGKNYEATPEPVSIHPEARDSDHAPEPEPAPMGPKDKGQKGATSGPAPVVPESNPVPEAETGKYPYLEAACVIVGSTVLVEYLIFIFI